MSDFGTLIVATKVDETGFSESELSDISNELENLITTNGSTNSLGDAYGFEFNEESGSEIPTIIVLLSEYYYGEDQNEDKDLLEFVKEVELEEAEEMANALKLQFPDFNFNASVDEW